MNLKNALFDGSPENKEKAIAWLRAQNKANLRNRSAAIVQDGKLYHGYTSDVDRSMNNAATRRQINEGRRFGEIQPIAAFDKAAVRKYAADRGIKSAEMYKNPTHLKNMAKDRDYSKFLLQDGAAKLVD